MNIEIGNRDLAGPVLIPSISRFETQIRPEEAIALQHALEEPITLVSAHDAFDNELLIDRVAAYRSDGGTVFLDSGGYEASRIGRYVSGYRDQWTFEKFRQAVEHCEHDLAASRDYFIEDSMSPSDYGMEIIDRMRDHAFIDREKLVPVVHLVDFAETRRLAVDEAVDVVDRVAMEIHPKFVAIPERELGEGFAAKTRLVKAICSKLRARELPTRLHVLGCGNPLAFAILAEAGIAMADGLEWCRTLVGDNYHLHHFQHGGLFPEPDLESYNPLADLIRDAMPSYRTAPLARNLFAFQRLSRRVREAIAEGAVNEFIRSNYGEQALNYLEQ